MVAFRYPTEADVQKINEWQADPVVVKFYNSGTPLSLIRSIERYLPNVEGEVLIVEDDGRSIGMLTVGLYSQEEVSIVYYLGEESRGKGLGSEMIGNFLDYAKVRGWKIIWAKVSGANYPSLKVLLDNGFEVMDKKKQAIHYPGSDRANGELLLNYHKSERSNK